MIYQLIYISPGSMNNWGNTGNLQFNKNCGKNYTPFQFKASHINNDSKKRCKG